jgi:hypothetical protein
VVPVVNMKEDRPFQHDIQKDMVEEELPHKRASEGPSIVAAENEPVLTICFSKQTLRPHEATCRRPSASNAAAVKAQKCR